MHILSGVTLKDDEKGFTRSNLKGALVELAIVFGSIFAFLLLAFIVIPFFVWLVQLALVR